MSSSLKAVPAIVIISALGLLAGCGGSTSSSDTTKQEAQVRAVQTQLVAAIVSGDSKAYCALTTSSRPNWSKQCLQVNKAKKLSRADKKALQARTAQIKQAKVQVDGDQAIVFLPGTGPQQFKRVDGKWLLNTSPSPKNNFAMQQKQSIRDRTRFYLMTVSNGDANAYCVVAIKPGQSSKECVVDAKKLFKSKGYSQLKKQVQAQVKGIDKASIDLKKHTATVDTGAGTINLNDSGPGHSWVIIS